jgi:ribosome biogenesis GTPase A
LGPKNKRHSDRGKMNKWSYLKDMIHGADVIVEVVDARDVEATRLPIAEKWAGSKRLMMIANKSDLLPEGAKEPVLQNKGIVISAKNNDERERRRIIHAIKERSGKRPIRALLIGYPNVGKSSIINMLAKRRAARVSPVAGTTKNIQWVKISPELTLSDYRGLFPSHEPKDELVRKGALNLPEDAERHAYKFAQRILDNHSLRKWIEERYDIDLRGISSPEEVLDLVAKRRGWLLKGGEPNIAEAARSLVRALKEAPVI